MSGRGSNFDFLNAYDAQLVRLGALAERYFKEDPNTSLIKLRQFAELLAQQLAARMGLYTKPDETFAELLVRLKVERAMPREAGDLFHQLRIAGNDAAVTIPSVNESQDYYSASLSLLVRVACDATGTRIAA